MVNLSKKSPTDPQPGLITLYYIGWSCVKKPEYDDSVLELVQF